MADTEHGHGSEHATPHLPDPSPWPFVAGVAGLAVGLALVWWTGDRTNQLAGVALGVAAAICLFAVVGWALEDSGMLRKVKEGGHGGGLREARYTQVVTFAVPEGRLESARNGVIAAIEAQMATFRNMEGFLDLRIIASPAESGPAQVLVETTWSGREELDGYEETRQSVLDLINQHPDDVLPGTVQAFDMQVVRDTKDVAFKFSMSAAAIVVVGLAVGGFVLAAALSAFQEEGEVVADGNGGGPGGFDGTIVARNSLFETERFEVLPATEIILTMDNQDDGTPHNIAIFAGPDTGGALLGGCTSGCTNGEVETEIAQGIVQQAFTFTTPADEGEYGFHCAVHPTTMLGTMVVSATAPFPAGPPPGAEPPAEGEETPEDGEATPAE
jgi:plastocyanin